jgi:DNA-directed RNA polymerase subunit RPC12/RpoP
MKTKLLYAYCPECGYQNIYHTDRKFRKEIRAQSWPGFTWQCASCGQEFESEVQWIMTSFEDWAAFWLYYRHFNWKILGVAFLACVLFAAGGFYFASYLPEWFQTLAVLAIFIAVGAGFLLLGEIPHAYPVYVVNNQRGTSRRISRRRTEWK